MYLLLNIIVHLVLYYQSISVLLSFYMVNEQILEEASKQTLVLYIVDVPPGLCD
jgi:hypothetical protein